MQDLRASFATKTRGSGWSLGEGTCNCRLLTSKQNGDEDVKQQSFRWAHKGRQRILPKFEQGRQHSIRSISHCTWINSSGHSSHSSPDSTTNGTTSITFRKSPNQSSKLFDSYDMQVSVDVTVSSERSTTTTRVTIPIDTRVNNNNNHGNRNRGNNNRWQANRDRIRAIAQQQARDHANAVRIANARPNQAQRRNADNPVINGGRARNPGRRGPDLVAQAYGQANAPRRFQEALGTALAQARNAEPRAPPPPYHQQRRVRLA